MVIYALARGKGKTIRLIQESAIHNYYLVVDSKQMAENVYRFAYENGLRIPFPITFDDLIKGRFYGRGIKGFLIDNADMLLSYLCRGVPLEGISLTTDPTNFLIVG